MQGKIIHFIKVWFSVIVSLCYCYSISKTVPHGSTRFLLIFPILFLFLYLPFTLSSVHIRGNTAFFLAWLGNFKLLLFAFGKGPLASNPSISLANFVAVACLPIKIQSNPLEIKPQNTRNQTNLNSSPPKSNLGRQKEESPFQIKSKNTKFGLEKESPHHKVPNNGHKSPLNYAIKVLLLGMLVPVYSYSEYLHPKVILLLYSFHIYFLLELILAITAAIARNLLGIELEPQFNEPYLSTSLQDFWGRRWNLMVTSILRPTVYNPILHLSARFVDRRWAPLPAAMATFLVSALMHELMFCYLGFMWPTGEVSWFFVLHGMCLTAEILLKKVWPEKWRISWMISGPLTVGFVVVTGLWLFIPQFVRCKIDVKAFEEYAALTAIVKNLSHSLAAFGKASI